MVGEVCQPGQYLQIGSAIVQIGRIHKPRQVEAAVEVDEEAWAWGRDLRCDQVGAAPAPKGVPGSLVKKFIASTYSAIEIRGELEETSPTLTVSGNVPGT